MAELGHFRRGVMTALSTPWGGPWVCGCVYAGVYVISSLVALRAPFFSLAPSVRHDGLTGSQGLPPRFQTPRASPIRYKPGRSGRHCSKMVSWTAVLTSSGLFLESDPGLSNGKTKLEEKLSWAAEPFSPPQNFRKNNHRHGSTRHNCGFALKNPRRKNWAA